MVNTIKINCTDSAYVDKYHAQVNFSKSNTLIAGILNNRTIGINLYKTILNFKLSDISPDLVKSAYIFIFVENMRFSNSTPNNIGICGNYEHINISNVNWNSFPKEGFTEILNLSMPKNSIGSYIKINVTSIIQELSKFDINYNFIFIPSNLNSSIAIKLGSCNSENPPYLKLELFEDDKVYTNTETEIYNNNPSDEKYDMVPGSSDIIFQDNLPDNIDDSLDNINANEDNSKYLYENDYSDNFDKTEKEDLYYENKDMSNVSDKAFEIQTFFDEVLNTLSYQSEILDNLKNNDNNDKFGDILLANTTLEKLTEKLDSQNLIMDSIKTQTSDNSINEDIKKINDLVLTLFNNIEPLSTILNEVKEISSKNSTSEEITSINSIITTLVNSLDIQSSQISSLKEYIENTCTKTDIDNINSSITEFSKNFNNQTSIIKFINETLEKTCSSEDLNATNNLISNLSGNIDSIYEIANSVKENTSNIPTAENINNINKLIYNIQNTIGEQNSQLEDIKNSFDNSINESYYKSINDSINDSLKKFDNRLLSFENTSSLLSNNFLDLNKEVEKLKNIVIPISENLELLNSDFYDLKNTILTSYTDKNDNSESSNTSEINSINEKLNVLCDSIEKVMDIISTITIEPLN